MKALYFDGKKAVYAENYKKPVRKQGESLIRILLAAVCNTDKEILKGYRPNFRGIMGHEFIGVVEESDCNKFIGKRVVGELNEGCGTCLYCRSGREKHCLNRKVIGMEGKDGCFAGYMTLSDHLLHVVPDDLSTKSAVFTEPLAAALEIPQRVHMDLMKNVAVIGDGRLSFLITQVLALYGMSITVIGKHKEKLKQFEPYAKTTIQPEETYEIVVEATGSRSGMEMAKQLVRKQGTIVIKSTYAEAVTIDLSYFVINEITLAGSRCGPFEPALQLLAKGHIKLPEVELYSLNEYEKAFSSKAFKSGFLLSNEEDIE